MFFRLALSFEGLGIEGFGGLELGAWRVKGLGFKASWFGVFLKYLAEPQTLQLSNQELELWRFFNTMTYLVLK